MSNNALLSVGLATYQRPEMLRNALESLVQISIPKDVQVQLILCENSIDNKSSLLLDEFKERLKIDAQYVQEPNKGIVFARNKILQVAISSGANFLAFFDDDEQVAPDWIESMYRCIVENEAHVVQGRVEPVFPPDESLKEAKKYFPSSPKERTGALLREAYTNNVLFDLAFVARRKLRFDLRLNDSGGSDSLFFSQLAKEGAKIIFCNEALVTETVPESRASIKWLRRRIYREGFNKKRIEKIMGGSKTGFWEAMKQLINYFKFRMLEKKNISDEKKVEYRFASLRSLGMFHSIIGIKISYYDKIDGF